MKKSLTLLAFLIILCNIAHSQVLSSFQNICYIKYSYDNAGNRTNRIYECGPNPLYNLGGSAGGGSGGGGGSMRIANSDNREKMIVFPNPTKGIFFVKLPEKSNLGLLEIRDPNGKILMKKELTQNQTEINITPYNNGEYFINVLIGDKYEIEKLLKLD